MAEFISKYQKGSSLRELSALSGIAPSTLRDLFMKNNVPLRNQVKNKERETKRQNRSFYGAIPYGYESLDGKIVVSAKEIKIVRIILAEYQKGMSFNAIAHWLNSKNIPSKFGGRWSDKTVASVIRRNKDKPI